MSLDIFIRRVCSHDQGSYIPLATTKIKNIRNANRHTETQEKTATHQSLYDYSNNTRQNNNKNKQLNCTIRTTQHTAFHNLYLQETKGQN